VPAALVVLSLATTGCLGGGSSAKLPPPHLIFGRSIGGVSIHEPKAKVEALLGTGTQSSTSTSSSGVTKLTVSYDGLMVHYAGADTTHMYTIGVETSSRRYRSSGGIGVGSGLAQLKSDEAIDCSNADSATAPSCQAPKGARGDLTVFALKDRRVQRLFLGPAD
jgi:hypothetical protein